MPKDIYFDCPVRRATQAVREMCDFYVKTLECMRKTVHYPPRDTDQSQSGIEICRQNGRAVRDCKEVHVFYDPQSQGIHFDLGMAFAYGKPVFLVYPQPELVDNPKSFEGMIKDWMAEVPWKD